MRQNYACPIDPKGSSAPKQPNLHDICPCGEPVGALLEIKKIIEMMAEDFNFALLDQLHADLILLFSGQYPGYRASNTAYHDVFHTNAVALAMTRILHGFVLEGRRLSTWEITIGVFAAFFHDTGLIQEEDDQEGTGAKYTIGHEQRSINLMRRYLAPRGFSPEDLDDCSQIIQCTILSKDPREIPFRTKETALLGKAMGSADLLAQMADRQYLEKLSSLYREFYEGGIPGYDSELEIINKTEEFFHTVAQRRLEVELDGVGASVKQHFRVRWGIDQDLYEAAICKNLAYLKQVREKCRDRYECYEENLRRGRKKKKVNDPPGEDNVEKN